jgi:type I pantothenate kinase
MNKPINNLDTQNFSPYLIFSAAEWADFRADTPLTLTEEEVKRLRALNDPIALPEVEAIYLSLSRLLDTHVQAEQNLFAQRREFLNLNGNKTPFVIGVAGSVAVGKSTASRILRELLKRWPASPKVELITTDGFLKPNAQLEKEGLMERKGFPESYDRAKILDFLTKVKAGKQKIKAPLYSHFTYDILPEQYVEVDQPDILIFEGINVLQVSEMPEHGDSIPFVSDFFDFSIYIDAEVQDIEHWYLERFMQLRDTAFRDPAAYFHKFSLISDKEAREIARSIWENTNLKNLRQNILPTRQRADVILHKASNHHVNQVKLRKL